MSRLSRIPVLILSSLIICGFASLAFVGPEAGDTASGRPDPGAASPARAAPERSRDPRPEGIERVSYGEPGADVPPLYGP